MRVWINSSLDYRMTDIPWRQVNIARFQIDKVRSNVYTAAGGSPCLSPTPPSRVIFGRPMS
jgi:hypothetical protein